MRDGGEGLLHRMAAVRGAVIPLRPMDSNSQVEFYGALNSHNHSVFGTEVFFENSPLKTENSQGTLISYRPALCRLFWRFLFFPVDGWMPQQRLAGSIADKQSPIAKASSSNRQLPGQSIANHRLPIAKASGFEHLLLDLSIADKQSPTAKARETPCGHHFRLAKSQKTATG